MTEDEKELVIGAMVVCLEQEHQLTAAGKPKVGYIEELTGINITAKQRDEFYVIALERAGSEEGGDLVLSEEFQEAVPPEEPIVDVWKFIKRTSPKRKPTLSAFMIQARQAGLVNLSYEELLRQYNLPI